MRPTRHDAGLRALVLCALALPGLAPASPEDDKAREEMQKALNKEVMSSPFNAGDIKKAEAYAQEAKRQNVAPQPQPPAYWRPGWTCADMTGYAYYNYMAYRNCVYYHHYYGYYWR